VQLLKNAAHASWCLKAKAWEVFENPARCRELSDGQLAAIADELSLPKAHFPCVREGISFLQMKQREHSLYPAIERQIFVTPIGGSAEFFAELMQDKPVWRVATDAFEQDHSMSTIRLDLKGDPVLDDGGMYSVVPAGHGALIKLLPRIRDQRPELDGIFIRNIDNVAGANENTTTATNQFHLFFGAMLQSLRRIRTDLDRRDVGAAAREASKILQITGNRDDETRDQIESEMDLSTAQGLLAEAMAKVFHSSPNAGIFLSIDELTSLYRRPLNILGVVPNSGHDLGGTPVIVASGERMIKICLEITHASATDVQKYFRDPQMATHFNPVFVLSELGGEMAHYTRATRDYWHFTRKTWQGREVAYFETVLFEILGNSELANTIFLEVPRHVFNPHKTLADCQARSLVDWSM
jgi:hypothetical protein